MVSNKYRGFSSIFKLKTGIFHIISITFNDVTTFIFNNTLYVDQLIFYIIN